MRLAWLTDIHLNFLAEDQRTEFLAMVAAQSDAVVISGDIGESTDIEKLLTEMERGLAKPVYFVLGNHDFYRGSVAQTRTRVGARARASDWLVYLTQEGVVELSPTTALVGHDGWADTRLGDFERSTVLLRDFGLIEELARHRRPGFTDRLALRREMQRLAQEAADHFARVLSEAAGKYREVLAVTHVPPFREAARYGGPVSDDDHLPFFASQVMGEAMDEVMRSHPETRLLVLCGHTHGSGQWKVMENLEVWTGGAEYGHPEIQRVLTVD